MINDYLNTTPKGNPKKNEDRKNDVLNEKKKIY